MIESAQKGCGLYSFGEVAHYLRVHPNTLRSWFTARRGQKSLLDGKILKTEDEGSWLSFDDFVQAYVISYLKKEGVNPRRLREALDVCRNEYGLLYPLSMKEHVVSVDHTTGNVLVTPPGEKHPIEATGRYRHHRNFEPVVANYLSKLEFGDDGQAARYVVWQEDLGGKTYRVVMDPALNFGEPTVEGTPYRALTLKDAAVAEGGVEVAAAIYEVDTNNVIVAIDAFQNAPELQAAA